MVFSFGILLGVMFITLYLAFMYFNVALVLLIYVEAILFVVALIWLIMLRFFIKARVEVPINISETGKKNMVKLTIINKLPITIHRMRALVVVEDTLSNTRNRQWMRLPEVYPGGNVFTHNVSFDMAGNFEVSVKKLHFYDLTGLFSSKKRMRSMDRVQIMPHMYDISVRLTATVKNFYGESDTYDEHSPGQDRSELFQVREYQAGDRLQNVHWKLTAKSDELMVKEHSLPKSCPVVLFLDFDPKSKKLRQRNALPFMEVATSLSYSMFDAGCAHYIVWYKADTRDIERIRVDDEESLYYFIGVFMKIKWEKSPEDIVMRYKDKYRAENYVWALRLDETLTLHKGEQVHTVFNPKDIEKSVTDTEIIL